MSRPGGPPARLPTRVADELATRVLRNAVTTGILPDRPLPDWDHFREFRTLVRSRFMVPETSITPLMARVLYGIALVARPPRVLGVGTYCGNSLVWLTGPGFGPDPAYQGTRAVGVDVNPEATVTAQRNFARIGADDRVEIHELDGHLAATWLHDSFDLLLLDADDPVVRKRIYLSLLNALLPRLSPGALVLAHDIQVPKFAEDMAEYQHTVRSDDRFDSTLSLEIDACGLELSRLKGTS